MAEKVKKKFLVDWIDSESIKKSLVVLVLDEDLAKDDIEEESIIDSIKKNLEKDYGIDNVTVIEQEVTDSDDAVYENIKNGE